MAMGMSTRIHHSLLLFISAALVYSSRMEKMQVESSVGINYGRIADNLPSPENAVPLLKSIGATRVKLYDADPRVLKAFANTNIQLIIGLGNEYLSKMALDPAQALSWVKTTVQCHLPATKITCIAVGNEVLTTTTTTTSSNDSSSSSSSSLASHLLPAMQNIQNALSNLNLHRQVSVTTPHSLAILQTSYPPSAAKFRQDLVDCILKIVAFHTKTGSPFLINAYPFLAYKANPKQVSLDFVLFQANNSSSAANGIILDPLTKLRYDNMLFAQIDAVHSAFEKIGCKQVCVQISETGWPSKGDADEPGASPENANKYNANLIKLIQQKRGTPMRPNANLNIYVFALFNENLKPGPTSERNFGLFKPDGTPAYPLGLGGTAPVSTSNTTSSGDSSDTPSPPNGYLSITSNTGRLFVRSGAFVLVFSLAASITLTISQTLKDN